MAYKYLVKMFTWENGVILGNTVEFLSEEAALSYARAYGMAETIKVYYDNEVLYSATQNPSNNLYA
jgi:hypothetical protein